MFDRVSEAAEKLANNVSRRAFMGGLGKGALALAGAMGAMLAFPRLVQATVGCSCNNGLYCCCQYDCGNGNGFTTKCNGCGCEKQHKGCPLSVGGCVCGPI
jgi:hypothetical protein